MEKVRLVADIDSELKKRVKIAATLNEITINEYVESALLAYEKVDKKAKPEEIEVK